MASGRNVSTSTLQQWAGNFRSNTDLSHSTNTAAISLEQLENYIKEVKEKYESAPPEGFRIYLVRYPLDANKEKIKTAGRNLSQPSLVIAPIKSYNKDKGADAKQEDYVLPNPGDVYVLAFSDPTSPDDPNDSTALCPPKCG